MPKLKLYVCMHVCMRTLPRENLREKFSSMIEKHLSREEPNKQMKFAVRKFHFCKL